jgi:hypothetical protein
LSAEGIVNLDETRDLTAYLTLKQADFNPPAPACPMPLQECRQDTRLCKVSRQDVRHCHADLDGPAVLLACDVHESGFCFDDYIVPGGLGVRAGRAIACWSAVFHPDSNRLW